jgi:hypothetical protein
MLGFRAMSYRSLLLLAAFLLFASPSYATTFVVDPGPTTVQAAIAQAANGDTVLMNPGRYVLGEQIIVISKSITLKSVAGPASTTIVNGDQIGSCIVIQAMAGGPTIEGLTIENGANPVGAGGAIYCSGASPTIIDNLIVWNFAGYFSDSPGSAGGKGGGIAVFNGSPTIQRNTIVANTSAAGGLYLQGGAGTVDHNVLAYNFDLAEVGFNSTSGFGYSCSGSAASVRDNIFWANLPAQVDPSCGSLVGVDGNVELDPRFCNPSRFLSVQADWSVRSDSPLAPGHSYYGWGAPTGTCAATDALPTTWGRLKSRYR